MKEHSYCKPIPYPGGTVEYDGRAGFGASWRIISDADHWRGQTRLGWCGWGAAPIFYYDYEAGRDSLDPSDEICSADREDCLAITATWPIWAASVEGAAREDEYLDMKTIGIVTHSAEGGALCFQTVCREGIAALGGDMHPPVTLSAVPMGLSMPAWEDDDYDTVAKHLRKGVEMVADASADFYICPDNTAHIVLEQIAGALPIPGLHIAEVVCTEIEANGWKNVGLLGTKWTMTGPVYRRALESRGLNRLIPDEGTRDRINAAIFEELCQGVFSATTTEIFVRAIEVLKDRGAECVILGCTEIPIIINAENSPLPVLDSTRLLARYAVREALHERPASVETGWLRVRA